MLSVGIVVVVFSAVGAEPDSGAHVDVCVCHSLLSDAEFSMGMIGVL